MTIEESKEILQGAIKKPNTKDGYLGQAITMGVNSLEAWEKVKAEIASLKGDNFPNSYYIKIIDKHLQEVEP